MTKTLIEKQLEELAIIAKEACDIGLIEIGRGWEHLTPNIQVYNADNSDHQSADLCGVSIGLFKPVKFQLELWQIPKLKEYLVTVKQELDDYKSQMAERSTVEAEAKKAKRIEILKKELEDLTKEESA